MNDPRLLVPPPRRRRSARFSNSRWTEPLVIAVTIALGAGCWALVEGLDLTQKRHGHAAILFVIVPPALFVIVMYDRVAGLLDRWLASKRDDRSKHGGP